MIKKGIVDKFKSDFLISSDSHEIENIWLKNEDDNFWNWVESNFIELNHVEYDPLESIGDLAEDLILQGLCRNAQIISMETDYDYYEGFMKYNGEYIYTGFNVKDRKVYDFTASKFKYFDVNSKYYGIEISKDIIKKVNFTEIKNRQVNINSLLREYYKENIA